MSNLQAFLKPQYKEETISVVLSDRFLDEDGKPVPFILKTLSQETLQSIARRSTKEKTIGGRKTQEVDRAQHLARCIVESCIQPDFKDHDLCVAYGTEDPYCLPEKMLLVREYEKLGRAFIELNGLSEDSPELGEISKK